MTRDDIIRMAREQGLPETASEGVFIVNSDDLGRMIAAEREACVQIIENIASQYTEPTWAYQILRAIRRD